MNLFRNKNKNIPDLWNYMTSLNKKDKKIFIDFLENDNEPLEFKGDVKSKGILKDKSVIHREVIQKSEDGRIRDYTQFTIRKDVYEILKPSYDKFNEIKSMNF